MAVGTLAEPAHSKVVRRSVNGAFDVEVIPTEAFDRPVALREPCRLLPPVASCLWEQRSLAASIRPLDMPQLHWLEPPRL
jgi:hypothetical protein